MLHRHRPERVEQHGLANSAQTGQHHAALRATARHTLKDYLELSDFAVAARQFGRALTGARSVRIANRIHAIEAYGLI
jgi:hypothetical protein